MFQRRQQTWVCLTLETRSKVPGPGWLVVLLMVEWQSWWHWSAFTSRVFLDKRCMSVNCGLMWLTHLNHGSLWCSTAGWTVGFLEAEKRASSHQRWISSYEENYRWEIDPWKWYDTVDVHRIPLHLLGCHCQRINYLSEEDKHQQKIWINEQIFVFHIKVYDIFLFPWRGCYAKWQNLGMAYWVFFFEPYISVDRDFLEHFDRYYGLNCVPLKSICWSPNLQYVQNVTCTWRQGH